MPDRSAAARWLLVALLAAVLAGVATLIVLDHHERHEQLAEEVRTRAAAEALQRMAEAELPTNAPPIPLEYSCHARAFDFECSFTNKNDRPVSGRCFKGRLSPKNGYGNALDSLTACSGKLGARSTVAIQVPWMLGHAQDACSSSARYGGGTVLDFDACTFKVDEVTGEDAPKAPAAL